MWPLLVQCYHRAIYQYNWQQLRRHYFKSLAPELFGRWLLLNIVHYIFPGFKDKKYIKLYQQLSNLLSEAQISKGKDLTQQETIALLNQATSRIIFDSVTQIPLYGDITRQKETTAQNFNAQTDSIVLSPKDSQKTL